MSDEATSQPGIDQGSESNLNHVPAEEENYSAALTTSSGGSVDSTTASEW